MSFGTWLFTRLHGELIGSDEFGNKYFIDKRTKGQKRERRWVIYKGAPEASKVPPEWHGWLHHTSDAPLPEAKRHPWMLEHQPNPTGTALAWHPAGHDYAGGRRARSAGDYEAWTPGS